MKKKVLFYNGSLRMGGIERVLVEVLQNLDRSNLDIDLIIEDGIKSLNVFEKDIPKEILDIEDSAYLISRGDFVITPDTSIVHIASALKKRNISVYPPKGGKFGVDHLVWAPKTEGTNVIFCRDKESKYDEIDINTFDFEEMKKLIKKLV